MYDNKPLDFKLAVQLVSIGLAGGQPLHQLLTIDMLPVRR